VPTKKRHFKKLAIHVYPATRTYGTEIQLNSISRYYKFLPGEQQQVFLENLREQASRE
jgi:hypothetical protein